MDKSWAYIGQTPPEPEQEESAITSLNDDMPTLDVESTPPEPIEAHIDLPKPPPLRAHTIAPYLRHPAGRRNPDFPELDIHAFAKRAELTEWHVYKVLGGWTPGSLKLIKMVSKELSGVCGRQVGIEEVMQRIEQAKHRRQNKGGDQNNETA